MPLLQRFLSLTLCALGLSAQANTGLTEMPATATHGPLTVFYPTAGPEQDVARPPFTLRLAPNAPLAPGNGALVVLSHGSGSYPWVYTDTARALVAAGFVVVVPEHAGNNFHDDRDAGPASWIKRPQEVSQAIDAMAQSPVFANALRFDKVGMYGMSAGGHTALSLAGGQWSAARFMRHCQAHIAEDFNACVGKLTSLTGGWWDGLKLWATRWYIGFKFNDDTVHEHTDPRVAAVVAGVPFAADFDPASLRQPKTKLALITAGADVWLHPVFHSDVVLAQCASCTHLLHLPDGGHGALLSPITPDLASPVRELIANSPGFNAAQATAQTNLALVQYFQQHLLPP